MYGNNIDQLVSISVGENVLVFKKNQNLKNNIIYYPVMYKRHFMNKKNEVLCDRWSSFTAVAANDA